ncbi:MAG: anhydro-N-acetylmuramic acid kinase [Aestuariivirga sp.]|uniref:anhydro-N-acetylmuramic acid kinase n=1 Tax=Aestuariivirga sp. TaxID=2650926 RepID=UPI0038CF9A58
MSGTSLDGIDVAMIVSDGEVVMRRGPSATYAYTLAQQALLRQALDGARGLTARDERPGILAEAEQALTGWHAEAVEKFAEENGISLSSIDIIGFHGQTVLHRPEQRLTVQLGLGEGLAQRLGRPVIYDLRAADVAAGGQGAPLVPVYHRALAAPLAERPAAFLNIGGVANMTWIGADGGLIAFDTGPGNALINDWCQRFAGEALDRDGRLAASGVANERVLARLLSHHYFTLPPPKSLDRNSFDSSAVEGLSPADGAATLTCFTAAAVAASTRLLPALPKLYVVCGGGRLNPVLMHELRELLKAPVIAAENLGLDGDSMEAEAWAYLAIRSLKHLPISFPGTTGVPAPLSGGRLAEP